MTITFRVPDMTCGHCADTIARAVAGIDPSAQVDVRVGAKLVRVIGSASESAVCDAIRAAGYSPERSLSMPATQAAPSGCCCASRKAAPTAQQRLGVRNSSCCG